MTCTAAARLDLIPPHRLCYRGRETLVGPSVWTALLILSDRGGRVPVADLAELVWGTPDASRRAVYSLCRRASVKLAAVGHPAQVAADGPDVVLA